jgi:O-antigen/teichoic acid export membrane protein
VLPDLRLQGNVLSKVRNSIAYSAASAYFALPLQLISTAVISRLLTPAEIGVFSIAAVFSSLASMFRDFGVAEYLIQEKELTESKIRACIALNLAVSWSMALLIFAGAPLAAIFYRDDGVATVMRIQALSFLIIPLGAVTMAQFRRDLDFKPLFISNVIAGLVSFFLSLGLAYSGFGAASLAWASLAGVVASVGMTIFLAPARYPAWPAWQGMAEVFRFGKSASTVYVLGQVGKSAPDMIIGYCQNLASVAIFSRANGLVELLNRAVLSAIVPVCLPYFAKGERGEGDLKAGYLKAASYITAIGWPFLVLMAIQAFAMVRALYGPQWLEAVPVSRIICAVGAVELLHFLAKEVLMAAGQVRASVRLQLGLHGYRLVGCVAGLPWGLSGVGWGLLLASVAGAVLSQMHLRRSLGLQWVDVISAHKASAAITLVVGLPLLLLALAVPAHADSFVWTGLLSGGLALVLWLLAVRGLGHGLYPELTRLVGRLKRPAGGQV